MNKTLLLVLTGTLALSIESCSYMSDFAKKRKEIENPPTISVKAKASEEGVKSSESEELAIESKKEDGVNRTGNVSGLIPSTNPEVRARSSKRGRQDPFAIISVEPRVEVKQDPKANRPKPTRRTPTTRPKARPETRRTPPTTRVRKPPEIKSTPTIEDAPKADVAESVLITGFVELGDRVKLIIQAPEEASSRYVEVGQYVSNGKVLVKRIEQGFPTPVVVLEESGIEVTKVIGVAEEAPEEEKANSLLPPAPPLSSLNSLSLLLEKEAK